MYSILGESYFANGEYTRASQAFEEAEQVANIDPALRRQARFQKGWILFRNQAYEQAQPIFEAVYAEDPTSELGAEALFWSGDSYYKLEQYSDAAKRFTLFIDNFPDHEMIGAARYSLGWSYFKTGDFERAVGPLEDFINNYNPPPIALYPYDVDTRLRVGDAYYALGDYRNAITFYNKAIGAEPVVTTPCSKLLIPITVQIEHLKPLVILGVCFEFIRLVDSGNKPSIMSPTFI